MIDSRKSVGSAILLGTLAVLSFIVQPAEVEGLTADLHMTDIAANSLIGNEMIGIALATILLAVIGHRYNWRHLLFISLVTGVCGDLLSAAGTHGPWLGLFRGVSGLGHGGLISLSFTFIGLTRRVERNLALYLVVLLTYGAFGILWMPAVLSVVHFPGLFLLFAAGTALGFVTIPFVPTSSDARQQPSPLARQLDLPFLAIALVAVVLYNTGMGAAWANLGLIGVRSGLARVPVNQALALSQFVGIGGALASLILAERAGRNLAIFAGTMGGAACMALLSGRPTVLVYTLAVCLLNFTWNFVQPFILAAVGDFDLGHRMISAAIATQMIGLGAGPVLSAYLISSEGFGLLEQACVLLLVLSYFAMFVPLTKHRARFLAAEPAI